MGRPFKLPPRCADETVYAIEPPGARSPRELFFWNSPGFRLRGCRYFVKENNDFGHGPHQHSAAVLKLKARLAEVGEQCRRLLAEMVSELQGKSDPSRFGKLLGDFNRAQLGEIDLLLALEQEQTIARVLEQRAICLAFLESFEEARKRPDLTRAEAIKLNQEYQRMTTLLRRSLIIQKQLIQQKLGSATWPGYH